MGTQISGFSLVHCITIEQLDALCIEIGLAQQFLEINQVWNKNSSAKHRLMHLHLPKLNNMLLTMERNINIQKG